METTIDAQQADRQKNAPRQAACKVDHWPAIAMLRHHPETKDQGLFASGAAMVTNARHPDRARTDCQTIHLGCFQEPDHHPLPTATV